jgi:hypothetical protein
MLELAAARPSRQIHFRGASDDLRCETTEPGAAQKRLKELEVENQRLRRAVSDLTLDKLILTEAARGNF